MKQSRRGFIKNSALASAGTLLIPSFLRGSAGLLANNTSGKKLIIIQLGGGNDGLNTVIPYRNDLYYKYRPKIGIPSSEVLKINDEAGLHPGLADLKYLYDEGWISIVNEVGYPNPNRSHFQSMDVWQSGIAGEDKAQTGWIGRYLDNQCEGCVKPYEAIEIDDSLSLSMRGESRSGLAFSDPKKFKHFTGKDYTGVFSQSNSNLHYIQKVYADTFEAAEYLYEKSKIYKTSRKYPWGHFGQSVRKVAELIISGCETTIYYVSTTGYDTHAGQAHRHKNLHEQYAQAMRCLMADLRENGFLDDTLILTFSEFGRRVKENASAGTDHGTANVVFLAGGKIKKPGLYNGTPDLVNLKNGDLVHKVDFRSIYATILENWLKVESTSVLHNRFNKLQIV